MAWATGMTGRNGVFGAKKAAKMFTQYASIHNYLFTILILSVRNILLLLFPLFLTIVNKMYSILVHLIVLSIHGQNRL